MSATLLKPSITQTYDGDHQIATMPTPAPARTHAQMLQTAARWFRTKGQGCNERFNVLRNVEDMAPEALVAKSIVGTPFAKLAELLHEGGAPLVETVGDIMGITGMTQHDVHNVICYCIERRKYILGGDFAARLSRVAGAIRQRERRRVRAGA